MTVRHTADKQLWVLDCDKGSLPLWVHPSVFDQQEVFHVEQPISYNMEQWDVLDNVLTPLTLVVGAGDWILKQRDIPVGMKKVDGVTPRAHLVWNGKWPDTPQDGRDRDVPIEPVESIEAETEVFLRHLCQRTRVADLNQMKLVWAAVQSELLRWLVDQGRGIDLGFCQIHAVPLRRNWKQVLAAKFPKVAYLFRMSKVRRDLAMIESGMYDQFRWPDMAAVNQTPPYFIHWTLEILPTMAFTRYYTDRERGRYKKLGKYDYARWWRKQIDKRQRVLYDIFTEFARRSTIPCAHRDPRSIPGSVALVPNIPDGRVRPGRLAPIETVVVIPDPTVAVPRHEEPAAIWAAPEVLPRLSDVLPGAGDVRQGGGAVESGDAEAGEGRMLVLSAPGGPVPEQRLLVAGDGGELGLAGQPAPGTGGGAP